MVTSSRPRVGPGGTGWAGGQRSAPEGVTHGEQATPCSFPWPPRGAWRTVVPRECGAGGGRDIERAMKQRAVGTTRQPGTQVLPRRHEPDAEVGVMLSPQNPELPVTALRAR